MASQDRQHPIVGRSTPSRLAWWTVGTAIASVAYLIQRVPMYRRNRTKDDTPPPDLARELPGDPSTLLRAGDGVGALYNRRYWIRVADVDVSPEELIDRIAHDPNVMAPRLIAAFESADGEAIEDLQVGDELRVLLPGPWDGPVRVVERTPTSIRLATLAGHMEAGEIEFRAAPDEYGDLRFEIESWARSGSSLFSWVYEHVPFAREAQLHMWALCCEKVADLSGGTRMSHVAAVTRRVEEE